MYRQNKKLINYINTLQETMKITAFCSPAEDKLYCCSHQHLLVRQEAKSEGLYSHCIVIKSSNEIWSAILTKRNKLLKKTKKHPPSCIHQN